MLIYTRMHVFFYLQEFGHWLYSREEFEYILDAANVGYNGQNFIDGEFSYEQVH